MTLVMTEADVTRPPVVGRLMTEAGILVWASPAQSGSAVEWPAPAGVVAMAGPAPRIPPVNRTMVASTVSRRALALLADLVVLTRTSSLKFAGPISGGGAYPGWPADRCGPRRCSSRAGTTRRRT